MTPSKSNTLRAVTLKTVANTTLAAELAVHAYRVGGHRFLSAMQRGFERAAAGSAERFAPKLAAVLRHAGDKVGGLAVKGLDAVSARTERAIEAGAAGVNAQVGRVAKFAARAERPAVVTGLKAVSRLTMPGARAGLLLSERLAAGADKLSAAAAGPRSARAKATGVRAKLSNKLSNKLSTPASSRRAAPAQARKAAATVAHEAAVKAEAVVKQASASSKAVKKAVTPVSRKAPAQAAIVPVSPVVKAARAKRPAKAAPVVKAVQDTVAAAVAAVADNA